MDEQNKEEVEERTNQEKEQKQETNELEEMTDRFKRLMAEFDNFKKRSQKEREGLYQSLLGDIVSAFLPVMDNLQKAASAQTQDESYKTGVEMVSKQFEDAFTSLGVQKIETVGKTFDPELHEAVSSVQDENLGEKEIKEEFRAGYKIGNRVIRHSMVVVAN